MEPVKEKAKAETAKVKANAEKKEDVLFVEKGTSQKSILEADKAGKKLIFDIVDFPEVTTTTLGKLSRDARIAYQMDARYAHKATARMDEGKSPYSSTRERIQAEDPLSQHELSGDSFEVQNKKDDFQYVFPDPRRIERLQRAGYQLVKPDDPEIVTHGTKKGDKVVIVGDNGNVDNVAMKVDKTAYIKHRESMAQLGQARLGENLEETKERMKQYAPKVNIYDKSKMYEK